MARLRDMTKRKHLYIKHIGMIIVLLGHLSSVEAQISQGGRP